MTVNSCKKKNICMGGRKNNSMLDQSNLLIIFITLIPS